jgi:GT2 family glycosyltransferase
MACTTSTWALLGGFCEQMFTYHEDTDLSLRCWQAGLEVRYVPEAVVLHDYEFSRNPRKMGLLERNRLIMLATLYERRDLVTLAPLLGALEVATLAMALRQGWWRDKIAGWVWLYRHRAWITARRRRLQDARVIDRTVFRDLLTTTFEPGQQVGLRAQRLVTLASASYLRLARR